MHVYRVKNKTHVERMETPFDKIFGGTKFFDCRVIIEIWRVERFKVGINLGGTF